MAIVAQEVTRRTAGRLENARSVPPPQSDDGYAEHPGQLTYRN